MCAGISCGGPGVTLRMKGEADVPCSCHGSNYTTRCLCGRMYVFLTGNEQLIV